MCKPYPGPRCSDHTLKSLNSAKSRTTKSLEEVKKASDLYDKAATRRDAKQSEIRSAKEKLESAFRSLEDAESDQLDAQKAHDSTPAGQRSLRDKIARATERNDHEETQLLTERLNEAVNTRAQQNKVNRILTAAEKRLENLSEDDQAAIEEEALRLEHRETELRELGQGVTQNLENLQEADAQVEQAQLEATSELSNVRQVHAEIAEKVREAYVNAGIPESRADHYTADTMHSLQSGWEYLSEDSADRAPLYGNRPTIKIKGFDHEDNLATAQAEESLMNDPHYAELVQNSQDLNAAYVSKLDPLKEAKSQRKHYDYVMNESISAYSTAKEEHTAAQIAHDNKVATYASGLNDVQTWDVDQKGFLSSAYKEADGTTNAYVLVKHANRTPTYVAVSEFVKKPEGSYILLESGDKIYGRELSQQRLKLTKPATGTKEKLFNLSPQ